MASSNEDEPVAGTPPQASAVGSPPSEGTRAFPIVGIGASAGGLAAFEAFFSSMPASSERGMAFVLVQHLAPNHKSLLSDLVKRYTPMQVYEVEDGMVVEPNCTYIIPPDRDMAVLNGVLQLFKPAQPHGHRLPIDFFFRSLAQDQGERAICIVLSGTGSDGTLGLRDIKGAGGMVMVQSPDSTEHDGMPRSAIATGVVDFVLPPAEMPARLLAYSTRAGVSAAGTERGPGSHATADLDKILVLLRARTGRDFSQYKRNTIVRRVERRMAVHQLERSDNYLDYLRGTPSEIDALFRDLLIGVTSFFRDPTAFQQLETQVIPGLVAGRPARSNVRVWVPGCSTGEEAYSIAMLLKEATSRLDEPFKVTVFATDVDARAIETARAGVYPASIAADVVPGRLARHFSRLEGGDYQVSKAVRDLLIFSEQDVTSDPPFSRVDLISCRNLLIYMGAALQRRLIPLFHYALNPGGALFLGTSETVGDCSELFDATDRKCKLYRKREYGPALARPLFAAVRPPRVNELPPLGTPAKASTTDVRELTELALLEEAPVAALVDEHGELLYLHGHTGRYLEPAPGEVGVNILKMAREGLRPTLTGALYAAVAGNVRVFRPGLRVKTNGDFSWVDLTVRPVPAGTAEASAYLVVFEPKSPAPTVGGAPGEPPGEHGAEGPADEGVARIAELERELRTKDEYLHATQEEMQTANEELKSSNEELQSTNEELQSTNEELETSKEELQSVNEELSTVNAELQSKLSDLSRVNNDMNNLLAGTGIGTLFVDNDLLIQRFTPAVTEFINLIQSDVGRPLGHIVSNLAGYDRLVSDAQAVLSDLAPKEVEVTTREGAAYLLRIRPYRTSENVIEGVVITFTEVTAIRNAHEALRKWADLRSAAGAVTDAKDAIIVHDLDGKILAYNPGAVRMYGWSEAEALGMNMRSLVPQSSRGEALDVMHRLSRSEVLEPYATQRVAKDGQLKQIMLTATALVNDAGWVYAVSTTERGYQVERPTGDE